MCNLQGTCGPKIRNVDSKEIIVLDILLSSGGTKVLNVMVNAIYYSYLLLVTGRRSYLDAGD